MSRRVASAALVVALLTLAIVTGSRSQEDPLVPEELHQKASRRGSVRVIVQLETPYVSEARLPSRAHVSSQRRTVVTTQGAVRDRLRGFPHRAVRDFRGALPLMAIEVGPEGLRMLESMRDVVRRVVEDRPRRPALVESVPRIQADQAAALGYDGTGTVIVIMDTGIEKDHPFFQDGSGNSRVVAEACFSTNDPAQDASSLCPGGVETSTAVDSALDCRDPDDPDDPGIDGCGHGTSVAGIAAGRGGDFSGVAPAADLVSIQIYSRFDDPVFCGGEFFTPCVGSFPTDEVDAALYVKDTLLGSLNVAAINLSLGAGAFTIPCDDFFPGEGVIPGEAQVISELRALGVATVAAAGNEGRTSRVSAPACLGAAVSVGATTDPPTENGSS